MPSHFFEFSETEVRLT